jgi:DEAD/DEAH box helicase domain-containing protein
MAVEDVIRLLTTNPVYRDRVVHTEIIEPAPPHYGTLNKPLSDSIASYLLQNNIRLYTHQCDAINHARAGKNVILTTPTASGKTLAFNIPVFSALEADPDARALDL